MRVLNLEPCETIAQITPELNSRSNVYIVTDRYGVGPYGDLIIVGQNLKKIGIFLSTNGCDDVRTSSLYDASQRKELYKHRWQILRLPLADAVEQIKRAQRDKSSAKTVVLGTTLHYKCVPT
jgi:hypothetical protein|eukprot:7385622-Prymnesium_polylepis.1